MSNSHSIVSSSRTVQSVGRSGNWTLEDNMVDGLFFSATLKGRRGGHTPFVQAGAEASNTGAEAVKPDPGSSWEGHSRRVGWGWKYGVSWCSPTFPHTTALLLLSSDEMMSCCAAGTKWVSRFEMPCIPTRWTGEHWVEQMSRLHGTTC